MRIGIRFDWIDQITCNFKDNGNSNTKVYVENTSKSTIFIQDTIHTKEKHTKHAYGVSDETNHISCDNIFSSSLEICGNMYGIAGQSMHTHNFMFLLFYGLRHFPYRWYIVFLQNWIYKVFLEMIRDLHRNFQEFKRKFISICKRFHQFSFYRRISLRFSLILLAN